jgi:hypothetical protein
MHIDEKRAIQGTKPDRCRRVPYFVGLDSLIADVTRARAADSSHEYRGGGIRTPTPFQAADVELPTFRLDPVFTRQSTLSVALDDCLAAYDADQAEGKCR